MVTQLQVTAARQLRVCFPSSPGLYVHRDHLSWSTLNQECRSAALLTDHSIPLKMLHLVKINQEVILFEELSQPNGNPAKESSFPPLKESEGTAQPPSSGSLGTWDFHLWWFMRLQGKVKTLRGLKKGMQHLQLLMAGSLQRFDSTSILWKHNRTGLLFNIYLHQSSLVQSTTL